MRAPDKGPGGDGDVSPGGKDTPTPIGEGLAILSLLSGGYFMLKKKNLGKK
ncbi:hypothetical protein FACS1894145_8020 [Bacteroidia bacterium]|nr:hypothetical protein FACS1894145_8020 [Bacteroidia bacterium]